MFTTPSLCLTDGPEMRDACGNQYAYGFNFDVMHTT